MVRGGNIIDSLEEYFCGFLESFFDEFESNFMYQFIFSGMIGREKFTFSQ